MVNAYADWICENFLEVLGENMKKKHWTCAILYSCSFSFKKHFILQNYDNELNFVFKIPSVHYECSL